MKSVRIKDSAYWDERLSWASVFYFICDAANATVKSVLNIPESMWGLVSIAFGLLIVYSYTWGVREMMRRSARVFWKTVGVFVLVYGYSLLMCSLSNYPTGPTLKGTALLTFAWWIPLGIFAASVRDKTILYKVWLKASYVISIICILLFIFHSPNDEQQSAEYNMSFGFKIILPLIFQMNDYLKNKRMWLLLFIVLQVLLILIYGNRGPLLAIIFFCTYKFAFESDSLIRKILAVIVLALFGIVMTANIQSLAEAAVTILDKFGYESRTLTLMAVGLAEKTSGRDEIWQACFSMIEDKPILGWGLGAEYFELGARYAHVPPNLITAEAYNPHNGLVQNIVCFGILGGMIANLMIILPFFHLKKKDKTLHELLLIFASANVVPLFVSSSGFFIKPGVAIFLFLYYYHVKERGKTSVIKGRIKYIN